MPVYFEAGAVITVLVLLGQVLELRARERTGGAIRALLDLAPKTARRIRADGTDEDIPLEAVAVGDRLRVRPGDKVPIDGEIVEGRSAIDESMVTGESMPVAKTVGERVIGGTANQSGSCVMRADRVGRDTVLAQIVQMVAEAQRSRAPIQRLADQVLGLFVPLVIAVAALAFVAWSTFGPAPRFTFAPRRRRLGADHRLPLRAGARDADVDHGRGRPRPDAGVPSKTPEVLERSEKVDTLVVDKTGTLTEGKPRLIAVRPARGFERTRCCGSPRAWSVQRASAGRGDRRGGPREWACARRPHPVRRARRQGSQRSRWRSARVHRQCPPRRARRRGHGRARAARR